MPINRVDSLREQIFVVRGQRVMLDRDLAELVQALCYKHVLGRHHQHAYGLNHRFGPLPNHTNRSFLRRNERIDQNGDKVRQEAGNEASPKRC